MLTVTTTSLRDEWTLEATSDIPVVQNGTILAGTSTIQARISRNFAETYIF
jgi:hypothetical protein